MNRCNLSNMATDENLWERACPLDECLEEIEFAARYVKGTFHLGEHGRERAERVQELANAQARCRKHQNPDFKKDWFNDLSNEDRFFWAVGGTDLFIDLLSPAAQHEAGFRFLLSDVTPAEVRSRKDLLSNAVQEQMVREISPEM